MSLIGASNPVGVGSGINFVGEHCYGYSGAIRSLSGGGAITMLDFVVPANNYLDCTVQFGFNGNRSNDDERVEVYVDEELVASNVFNNNYSDANQNYFKILFAPNAHVRIAVTKVSGTDVPDTFAWIRGRVYA